jgi:hydrogenase maturation protease
MKPGEAEKTDDSWIPPRSDVLVIGYGNELRSDDAAGPRAARAVAELNLPGVIALAVPQLTPELAEPLASSLLAIFVDACLADQGQEVEVQPLELSPPHPGAALGHTQDPRGLLNLARTAYARCPASWLVTIPATDFSLGGKLSPQAARGVEQAVPRIVALAVKSSARVDGMPAS